jgi:hypothetical protein
MTPTRILALVVLALGIITASMGHGHAGVAVVFAAVCIGGIV